MCATDSICEEETKKDKIIFGGGTAPHVDCDHPVDMSRLSRRHVQFVSVRFRVHA